MVVGKANRKGDGLRDVAFTIPGRQMPIYRLGEPIRVDGLAELQVVAREFLIPNAYGALAHRDHRVLEDLVHAITSIMGRLPNVFAFLLRRLGADPRP